ncbi:MAG: hypothetical protein F6K48_08680 [Okeania sp. SIO3H1]|nr:hypothetical protein [Okeania sp. SIO3H1]
MQSEQKMMKSSKLPIQAVPVERTVTGVPMSNQNGVDPSFDWAKLATELVPAITSVISSFLSKK